MKFISVINKKQPLTSQLNALAHTTLGLPLKCSLNSSNFSEFLDGEGRSVSYLTDSPFIILAGKNSNQLRRLHEAIIQRGLPHSAFFRNMIDGGTVQEQLETVANSELSSLDYVAVLTFGSDEELDDLTKKFSLYKNPD